jgi:hypothetical protein
MVKTQMALISIAVFYEVSDVPATMAGLLGWVLCYAGELLESWLGTPHAYLRDLLYRELYAFCSVIHLK